MRSEVGSFVPSDSDFLSRGSMECGGCSHVPGQKRQAVEALGGSSWTSRRCDCSTTQFCQYEIEICYWMICCAVMYGIGAMGVC